MNDIKLLQDIYRAIAAIESYKVSSFEEFKSDPNYLNAWIFLPVCVQPGILDYSQMPIQLPKSVRNTGLRQLMPAAC